MTRHYALAMALLLAGCAKPATATDQTAAVAGWQLHLLDRDGVCVLEYAKDGMTGEFTLAPAPPCRFVDEAGAFPQTEQFKSKGSNRTLVIVFGTPYRGAPVKLQTKGAYCGTDSQAVMLADKDIRLSRRVAAGGIRCEGYGVDQREFVIFDEEWR